MSKPELTGNVQTPSPFDTVAENVVLLLRGYNPEAAMRLQKAAERGDVVFGHSTPLPSAERLPIHPLEKTSNLRTLKACGLSCVRMT